MGNILAIECSPRSKGSSSAIVDAFTDGAMGLSTNIIDLYRMSRLRHVGGCLACGGCKGTGRCVQNDDISEILEKMRAADCVVISTPVYFGGPSSQYKMVEDRMYSFFDQEMRSSLPAGKKAVVVVTCSGPVIQAEKVAKGVSQSLAAVGFEIEAEITYSDDGGRSYAGDDDEVLRLAKGVGQRFRNT